MSVSSIGFLVACLLFIGGCVDRVTIGDLHSDGVQTHPTQTPLGQAIARDFVRPGESFVRVSFAASENLIRLANRPRMALTYDFYTCDHPDMYIHSGDLFYNHSTGRFEAYIPHKFADLEFWVTGGGSGQTALGWPAEVANETLCFRVGGGVPYIERVRSNSLRVDAPSRQFDTGMS